MSAEPTVRKPEGQSLEWVTSSVDFPIPCWIDGEFYKEHNTGGVLVSVLNALADAIRSAEATEAADNESIYFDWWHKPSPESRKMKPEPMRATLFRHPDYDSMWCYIERDN